MNKTEENLKVAFAGESQANRRYTAFARKAEKEGLPNVARLFRAIAEAETVHALKHLNVMGMVKSTKENLQTALNGEVYEFTEMYPSFIKAADEEKMNAASASFGDANKVERIHSELFKKAISSVESRKDIETKDIFVCQVCGNTVEGKAPDICPVCGSPKEKFKKIE